MREVLGLPERLRRSWMVLMVLLLSLMGVIVRGASQVEIFSWWTGNGEEEGLQALIKVFERNNPGIEVINASVAGGGGVNAKAVLQTRMVGGNSPDSFQVHGGAELINSYVKTGMMEPLTKLVDAWGIRDRFYPQILEMCSFRGEIYSIPLNVHRGNVLWYNKKLLKQFNLKPPRTFDELLRQCQVFSKAGINALVLGDRDKWETTQIFETILLINLGPDKYNGLWNGRTSFTEPGIRRALEQLQQIMNYANKDHSVLTWQDATERLYKGEAVFNIMGDWAEGYLKTLGGKPGVDFGWVALSGPEGSFMIIIDTFGLPKGAPHRRNAIEWLKIVASVEGQDIFNPIKGSIPSRLDADRSLYDSYLRSSMADFSRLKLTPSIAHGSAASLGFSSALDDLLSVFVADGDIEAALRRIKQAAATYLE